MDREIQFHALLKDELIYEVTIRSETPANTVAALKKQLRNLINECPSEAIACTDYTASAELQEIASKLIDLEATVTKFENSRDRYSLYRSRALGYHLFHRLTRVQTDEHGLASEKAKSLKLIESLLGKIEGAPTPTTDISDSYSETIPAQLQPTLVECSGVKDISKWNVRFNGTSDPRSFIERVEELKLSHGTSDSKLFNSAVELFVDQALLWFRGIKLKVSCWSELKALLLEEFDLVDYDYRLLGDIRARTQGVDEPVHIYFAIMACLFARLKTPLTEDQQLEILLHNIRPLFSQQLALLDITSVSDLKQKCRRLEAARQRSDWFTEPKSSALSTEFSYKTKNKVVAAITNSQQAPKSCMRCHEGFAKAQQSVARSAARQTQSRPICFKCGKTNHNFRTCQDGQGSLKCFKCGELGCTVRTCPKCNKNSKN